MTNRCETCKYADKDYCEGVGPGYPRGYTVICGCLKEETTETFDILAEHGYSLEDWESGEIGDIKDCPLWEEEMEDCYD